MTQDDQTESLLLDQDYDDFKWIDPQEIVVAQWVRMKCEFGCPS